MAQFVEYGIYRSGGIGRILAIDIQSVTALEKTTDPVEHTVYCGGSAIKVPAEAFAKIKERVELCHREHVTDDPR